MRSCTTAVAIMFAALIWSVLDSDCLGVEISKTQHQGRPQLMIRTESCVWFYDIAGGGFSRLIDRDGRDWIAFSKEPLSKFPQSAAAGYRGIPNAVFVGPDKGAGHPGFDRCTTSQIAPNKLLTESKSGDWAWSWEFFETHARFEMVRAGTDPWWFLYEGPVAGTFQPEHKFWGTDQGERRQDQPDNRSQHFGSWQRLYCGDGRVARALFIHQEQPDDLPDTFWYLGNCDGGSASCADGMVVVGFGRGPGTTPQNRGAGHQFSVGLVELPRSDASGTIINERIDQTLQMAGTSRRQVTFFYGEQQEFGRPGLTQRWVNLLGNIGSSGDLVSATYQLDANPAAPLTIGSDLHRLARDGDFNVELAAADLEPGEHTVRVIARWGDGTRQEKVAQFEFTKAQAVWPLPYKVDFSNLASRPEAQRLLQQSVQIIDGKWRLTAEGLRTEEPWYDRVVGVGDASWKDYEAIVRVTIHGFTPPQPGPPTFNVSHCGLALRWHGHSADSRQPSRKWYPMGTQGELLLRLDTTKCQWRALAGKAPPTKPTYGTPETPIEFGQPMLLKARVQTIDNSTVRYRFKHWLADDIEPDQWFVESTEALSSDFESGAFLVVPHNSDVSIHSIDCRPLASE